MKKTDNNKYEKYQLLGKGNSLIEKAGENSATNQPLPNRIWTCPKQLTNEILFPVTPPNIQRHFQNNQAKPAPKENTSVQNCTIEDTRSVLPAEIIVSMIMLLSNI